MTKNFIPETLHAIHLIAACGTGMGALAGILKSLGYAVTGSDHGVYPPMSDFLAARGITVTEGFDAANLAHRPDLVVVGNAVSRENPEAVAMMAMGLPFCSMTQAVNRFLVGDKKVLMVAGTHGKTTTCSLLAWTLHVAGLDPSFFIGGILRDFNSNYRLGNGDFVVIEGDEYDTAFFDKGPKFLHFAPHAAVLTSVEFDHADIYRDFDHVQSAFDRMIAGFSPETTLFAYDGDETVARLGKDRECLVRPYGKRPESPWRLAGFGPMYHDDAPWTRFAVLKDGTLFGEFRTKLVGEHNLMNALAVIAVADRLGVPVERMARALERFQGPRRRQEIRGVRRGVTVMDDFAHHPTAVRETVRAVKPLAAGGRLIAVFEPRTNTSMRNIFQEEYAAAFDGAEMVCIRKPSRLDKVPPDERLSSEQLVDDLNRRGVSARHFEETDAILDFLPAELRSGDLVLIMSNGGFDNIHARLLDLL